MKSNSYTKEILKVAISYRKLGLSVIPIKPRDKTPLIEWQKYQKELANEETIKQWWNQWPNANVGVVTGNISKIVVVDVEKGGKTDGLLPTATVKTGGGGWHFYYHHPGKNIPNAARIRELTDVRGDGGYVVAPPSIHSSGNQYEWNVSLEDDGFAELPKWISEKSTKPSTPTEWDRIIKGVPEGERNTNSTKIIGKLFALFPTNEWKSICWPLLCGWNIQNKPSLPEKELWNVFTGIAKSELTKKETWRENQNIKKILSADEILQMPPSKNFFLVEKLIPDKGITVISGYPESGKSWIILYLAKSIALGKNLFEEYAVVKAPILIVDEESGIDEFQRRMKLMNFPTGLPVYFYCQQGLKVDNPKDIELISQTVKEKDIKLVVFDPFSAIHSKTENNAEEMQKVMECLQKINLSNAAVLFAHHHRKELKWKITNPSQSLRGSSVLFSRVDSHIAVEKEREDETRLTLIISQEKLRRGKKVIPFKLELLEEKSIMSLQYLGEFDKEKNKKEQTKEAILRLIKEANKEMNKKEIQEILKEFSKNAVGTALKELAENQKITYWVGKSNKHFYSLLKN